MKNKMHRILSISASVSLAVAAGASGVAETSRPSWEALPSDTVFAIRIPNGNEFFNAIKGTQIGRHLFSEERIDEYLAIVERERGDDWHSFRRGLGEHGFEPRDLVRVLSGETGAALVLKGGDGSEKPRQFLVFWAEPGEELGARAFDALLKAMTERETDHPAERVDFRLAGHEVTHFADPQVLPDAEGNERVTHNAHTFLARKSDRILGVMTLLSGPDLETARAAFAGETDPLPEPDPEPSEEMRRLFAHFLQAHDGGEPGGFSRDLLAMPGVADSLPRGVAGLEIGLDPERIFQAVLANSDDPNLRTILESLGVLDLRRSAMRGTVDRGIFRWGGLLSIPSPRRGVIAAFVDQPALEARPFPWVPAHVTNYSHFSLDFGRLFATVRDIVVETYPEAAQGFQMVEMQVAGMLQADIATLLSSFGNRHTFVALPPAEGRESVKPRGESPVFFLEERSAVVWTVDDESLWQRVMQAVAMFAPMMGGALHAAEEQGFSGWRMEANGFEGGLLLGDGQLVLGFGQGTLEEVLSAMRNPPSGEHAFVSSSKFRQAQGLMDLRPGIYWDVQDVGKQLADVARAFGDNFRARPFGDADGFSRESAEQLIDLFDPELIGEALGMGVNQVYATRDGIRFESAQYLSPAED